MLEIWTPFEPFSGSSLNHRDLEFELSDNRVRPAKKKWLAASSVTLVGLVQAGRQFLSATASTFHVQTSPLYSGERWERYYDVHGGVLVQFFWTVGPAVCFARQGRPKCVLPANQPAIGTSLSEQTSTGHQPPAKRTRWGVQNSIRRSKTTCVHHLEADGKGFEVDRQLTVITVTLAKT
jgi:hypothetical protein